MSTVILWLIVIFGYLLSFLSIVYVFLIAISFFRKAPYVPLNRRLVKEIVKYFEISSDDSFIDIGSGDGYIVLNFAKETKGISRYSGVEIDKILVIFSNITKIFSKYSSKISFITSDAMQLQYSQYNKVFMYLTTEVASSFFLKLSSQFKKGTIIISAIFPFSQEIQKMYNVKEITIEIKDRKYKIYRIVI